MRTHEFFVSTLAITLLGATARGSVIVVNAAGGGQFTQISSAVAAAQDGDTILVKAGTYVGFSVNNKSLTIVAETGANVRVDPGVKVLHLVSTKTVVLSGLHIDGMNASQDLPDEDEAGLYVNDNAGPVRVEDCTIVGGFATYEPFCGCEALRTCNGGIGAMVVANSAGVAFSRCTVVGGSSDGTYACYCEAYPPTSRDGNTGLFVKDGIVAVYDCTIWGGRGGPSCSQSGRGGTGARATSKTTLAGIVFSGSTVEGGWGGGDTTSGDMCLYGGDGGGGLLVDPGAAVWRLETTITGGLGYGGTHSNGQNGQDLVILGKVFPFTVPRLKLEAPSTVRELQVVPMTIRGRPGDQIYVYMGRNTPFTAIASWHGVRLAQNPHPEFVAILGPIPPSGVMNTEVRFSDLGPSVASQNWYFQVWRNSPIDGRTLGSFRVLTVLDTAY